LIHKLNTEHVENLSSRVGCRMETGSRLLTGEYTLYDITQFDSTCSVYIFLPNPSSVVSELVTSAEEGRYVFTSVCSVCLSVG